MPPMKPMKGPRRVGGARAAPAAPGAARSRRPGLLRVPSRRPSREALRRAGSDVAVSGGGEFSSVEEHFPFPLDEFQASAVHAMVAGESVMVAAPTGSGKTAVAEAAGVLAARTGKRMIYTTPLKALSNQKLRELQERFGEDNVGLITGDVSFQPRADIVVMTTEILRNILYSEKAKDADLAAERAPGAGGGANDRLEDVEYIVLDEVHYIGDPHRGRVWEECIIYCPTNIKLVCLSATIANAPDLVQWMNDIHGASRCITSDFRPVPLRFHYLKAGPQGVDFLPLLDESGLYLNPDLKERRRKLPEQVSFEDTEAVFRDAVQAASDQPPSLEQALDCLVREDMLPAIYFIFRRKGCDSAAKAAARKHEQAPLVSASEAEQLRGALRELREAQPDAVREDMVRAFQQGFASHHAGSLPGWKALVEKCFQRGLIKVVFATDTLAAGINMPARTTVIAQVNRPRDNRRRSLLSHNELLQMAGRAGRRGFDTVGHCVLLGSPDSKPDQVAQVIRRGPEPVHSQFAMDYGMALNLVDGRTLPEAQALIRKSFLNYQGLREEGRAGADARGGEGVEREEPRVDPRVQKRLDKACGTLQLEQKTLDLLLEQAEEVRAEAVFSALTAQVALPCTAGLDFGRDSFGRGVASLMPGLVLARLPDGGRTFLALGADNRFYLLSAARIAALGPDLDEAQLGLGLDAVRRLGLELAAGQGWADLPFGVRVAPAPPRTAGVAAGLPPQRELALVGVDPDTDRAIADSRGRLAEAKAAERRALRDVVGGSQAVGNAVDVKNYVAVVTRWLRSRQQTPEGRLVVEEAEVAAEPGPGGEEAGAALWQCTVTDRLTRDVVRSRRSPRKALAKQDAFRQVLRNLRRSEGFVEKLQELNTHLMALIEAGCVVPESFDLTALGRIAAELKGDNELWLALALTSDAMFTLTPSELAGAVCALVTADSVRVKDVLPASAGSEAVVAAVTSLEPVWTELTGLQRTFRVGRDPVIDVRLAGLAEQWAEGCAWGELLDLCSLEDGDLARLLNRTMDVLNQVRGIEELPRELRGAAREAARACDRQPISDW